MSILLKIANAAIDKAIELATKAADETKPIEEREQLLLRSHFARDFASILLAANKAPGI